MKMAKGLILAWAVGVLGGTALTAMSAADNPTRYSQESIARGKTLFLQNCQDCHGEDGKAQGSAIAVAPDLTRPERWKYGQTDDRIFSNIRDGAGDNMPPFGRLGPGLTDPQIWDLVNFIRSIGPESKRSIPRP
jgi:mono/diheme cytochrome c family protein